MNIQLYKKELHEKELQDYFLENIEDWLKIGIRWVFSEEDGTYWDIKLVYIENDKVVWFLEAETCSVQKKIELSHLFVHKDYRKKWIAKKMFNFMINYYVKLEMNHVKVMYFSNNNVWEFYKKLWFEENFVAKYWTVRYWKWLKNINLIKFL